jgi:hypothetical protein
MLQYDETAPLDATSTQWIPSTRAWYAGLILVLLASVSIFVVRTALQPQYRPSDFATYYTAARAWLHGADPYSQSAAPLHWQAADGWANIMPDDCIDLFGLAWLPIIQMPSAMPVFAPFALFSAKTAVALWFIVSGVLLIAQTAALARMAKSRLWQPTGIVLLSATLVLAPVHELFGWAQPSGPTISFIVLGAWAAMTRRDILAGTLLALATAIKPQLGGLFFIYFLLKGRQRIVLSFAAVMAALFTVAIVPMQLKGINLMHVWLANVSATDGPGGMNNTAIGGPARFYMLHLQVILNVLVESRNVMNFLAGALVGITAAVFAHLESRGRVQEHADELLELSFVAALALLPVYHRFYDAGILVLPMTWALANFRTRPSMAIPMLAIISSFFIPVIATVRLGQLLDRLDPTLTTSPLWHLLIDPWRVWTVLACLAVLFRAAARQEPDVLSERFVPLANLRLRRPAFPSPDRFATHSR